MLELRGRERPSISGAGMVSGLFFAIAVIVSGVRRFREQQLNHAGSDIRIGRWWEILICVVVPLEALVLLGWWLFQARGCEESIASARS